MDSGFDQAKPIPQQQTAENTRPPMAHKKQPLSRRIQIGLAKLGLIATVAGSGAGAIYDTTGVEVGGPLPIGAAVDNAIIKPVEDVFGTKASNVAENKTTGNEYKADQSLDGINTTTLTIREGVNIRANPRTTYNLGVGKDADERIISWEDIVTVNGKALNGSRVFDLDSAVVFKGQNAHSPASSEQAPWALVLIGKKDGSEEPGFIFLGGETSTYVTGGTHIEWIEPNKPFTATDSSGNVISPSEYGKVTIPTQLTPIANNP